MYSYECESLPMRVPVITHTTLSGPAYPYSPNTHPFTYSASYDSAYESKSDSESSNSSIDVGSGGSGARSPSPGRSVTCRWTGCGQVFAHLDELAAHVTSLHAHNGPAGLFFCGWESCSRGQRGFNARYKMLVHVRTHTNEKPHHCFQCDKSFSRAENLKIHARSHTGERPYVCPVAGCGKAYSNSSDRFKHTRTHSVDKPYTCKVPGCGKKYTDPSSLRKHVKTYRHFRTTAVPPKAELPYEEEAEHEQIVPETDEVYTRLCSSQQTPQHNSIGEVRSPWPASELSTGMQWEHTPLWCQPPLPWLHPTITPLTDHDMPLDLSVHK